MNELKLGVRGHDIQADSLSELAVKCDKYGVKSIQLVLKRSCENFKEGIFSPSFAKYIGKVFADKNIDIDVLGCYINPSCTDENSLKSQLDFFVENLKYARYMNAGVVGLETGYIGENCIPDNNHTEGAYQHLLSNMKFLCTEAEKLGVTIAVEGVFDFVIGTPKLMHRLVYDLNSPNIVVIFDIFNLLTINNYKNQDEIMKEMFALLGDKISIIHLKDFKVVGNKLEQCKIGEGILNIPLLLSLIKENKPYIPIILEEVKEDVLVESMKYLDRKV